MFGAGTPATVQLREQEAPLVHRVDCGLVNILGFTERDRERNECNIVIIIIIILVIIYIIIIIFKRLMIIIMIINDMYKYFHVRLSANLL